MTAADPDDVVLLKALAEERGITIRTTIEDDGETVFWASRWGLTRSFASTDALREWLLHSFGIEVQA